MGIERWKVPGVGRLHRFAPIVAVLALACVAANAQTPLDETVIPLGPASSESLPLVPSDGERATSGMPAVIRTVLSLAVVITLILVGAALLRRLAGKGGELAAGFGPAGRSPAGLLEVLGRYPIGHGQRLVLLKLDRRVLLLVQQSTRGGRGTGVTTLCEIADPDEVASILTKAQDEEGTTIAAKFRELVTRFDSDHDVTGTDIERETLLGPDTDRAELIDATTPRLSLVGVRGPIADAAGSLRRRLDALRGAGEGP